MIINHLEVQTLPAYFVILVYANFFFLFQELVISQNFSGHLVAHTEWPAALKNKGVYFIKRDMKPLPKENFLNVMTCGDIHPNALDHFCAWVEEVSITYQSTYLFMYLMNVLQF